MNPKKKHSQNDSKKKFETDIILYLLNLTQKNIKKVLKIDKIITVFQLDM